MDEGLANPKLHLLFLAYYFPPDGGAGTQRVAKLCQYLPRSSWDITIITRGGDQASDHWDPKDQTLLSDGPTASSLAVHRVSIANPCRKNALRQWADAMGEEARRVSDTRRIDIAVVSMSPYELERPARRLAKDCGYPVVLDLRDPWAIDGWHVYRTFLDWYADFLSMKRTFRSAAGIIANTAEAAAAISSRVLGSNRLPLAVIPNGYDESDFAKTPPIDTQLNDRLLIVHAGYLHDRAVEPSAGIRNRIASRLKFRPEPIKPSGRTVAHLARALSIVQSTNPGLYDKLLIVLVGVADDATRRQIDRIGHAHKFRFVGYVSHATSIAWLKRADALFLPLHGLPSGYRSLIVPGKTYEYVASGKPILGAVPPGDAQDILNEYGRAVIVNPIDPQDIAIGLERVAMLAKDSTHWKFPPSLRRFRREILAQQFSSFLHRVILEHRHNEVQESLTGPAPVR